VIKLPVPLVGDGTLVPCIDGTARPYVALDAAASTGALETVLERVEAFLPSYSSVHRGAGQRSQLTTKAYEDARDAALSFAGRDGRDDIAIMCRNTTEAMNHLAYQLRLAPDDTVVTTVVEHHANLLPWSRAAKCRYVECRPDGTFTAADVEAALDGSPRPRLLAVTAASNITGWLPPMDEMLEAAHRRKIPVAVDGAQLAPHRPLPSDAEFIAWSGHKMYAPFGTGVLIGPRETFTNGDPFLVGGGAVDLVELDEVVWTAPPERQEAGSPNVVGAVALHAAMSTLSEIGWAAIIDHDRHIGELLRDGLAGLAGVHLLGPEPQADTLPLATFTIDNTPHALVAARLSAEDGIGVRHGCFCAHPYLMRLLGLTDDEVRGFRDEVRRGDRTRTPGAVRASAGINTTEADISRLIEGVARIASDSPAPVAYFQDPRTGDFFPDQDSASWYANARLGGSSCSPG
jgi:selenocysteine lyase/cysteine desulfurase